MFHCDSGHDEIRKKRLPLAKAKDRYQLGGKDNSKLGMKSSGHRRAFVLSFFRAVTSPRFLRLQFSGTPSSMHLQYVNPNPYFGSRPPGRYYSLFFARDISSLMLPYINKKFDRSRCKISIILSKIFLFYVFLKNYRIKLILCLLRENE